MLKRKVVSAKLHQSAHISGIGDLTATLPPQNKSFGLEMTLHEQGVEIFFPVQKRFALIPFANIVIMELGPEPEQAASSSLPKPKGRDLSVAS